MLKNYYFVKDLEVESVSDSSSSSESSLSIISDISGESKSLKVK